ncbi:anti-sigma factor [Janibacter sp. UYMM211]|uniref:anti-sigma factor n=1 Tax=Janibacter sp. UYMM211 TaxID=3156342 RepID=UPI00339A915D
MNAELHTLTGAYALGALDDAERSAFEEHLRDCAACREEVASFAELGPLLASDEAVSPPPSMRASVLSGITQTRQLPPLVGDQDGRGDDETTSDDIGPQPARHADVVPITATRRWGRRVSVLAAAAALAVGGTVAWQVTQTEQSSQTDMAQLVMDAPDARTARAQVTGGGTVEVVRSASMDAAVLVPTDLPETDADKRYQAWLADDSGTMHASTVFASGSAPVLLTGDASGATGVGLTIEPSSGSKQPTSDPIAVVAL